MARGATGCPASIPALAAPGARPRAAPAVGPLLAYLAAVLAPVLALQRARLCRRGSDLRPLAVLEDDLVAAGKNLERPRHLAAMVELARVGLAEDLEVRRVDEVRHLEAVHA